VVRSFVQDSGLSRGVHGKRVRRRLFAPVAVVLGRSAIPERVNEKLSRHLLRPRNGSTFSEGGCSRVCDNHDDHCTEVIVGSLKKETIENDGEKLTWESPPATSKVPQISLFLIRDYPPRPSWICFACNTRVLKKAIAFEISTDKVSILSSLQIQRNSLRVTAFVRRTGMNADSVVQRR
jgi:hypothetical protein